MSTYTVRAFLGFDSHAVKIVNRDELAQPVRAAFVRAAEAGQIKLPVGFAQDAIDVAFDPSTAPAEKPWGPAGYESPFGICKRCGREALMTTLPQAGICDDCA